MTVNSLVTEGTHLPYESNLIPCNGMGVCPSKLTGMPSESGIQKHEANQINRDSELHGNTNFHKVHLGQATHFVEEGPKHIKIHCVGEKQ